jgi:ribbon-helix-helix protein
VVANIRRITIRKDRTRDYAIDSRMAAYHTRGMKRTTIWLSDQQVKELAKLSKKTGIKQAELIRRFIDAGVNKSPARK